MLTNCGARCSPTCAACACGSGWQLLRASQSDLTRRAAAARSYAFDTVKVRLQTGKFDGMRHAFRHIVQTEGVRGSLTHVFEICLAARACNVRKHQPRAA